MTTLKDLGLTEKQAVDILTAKQRKPSIIKRQMTEKEFTFGVVSDTHLCSTHEKLDELHTIYEIFRKSGITVVFNAGDLVSGWNIYAGQESEVHTFGADGQINYFCKNYPRVKGITTYFITGNHCDSWRKIAGINIGERIAEKRSDLIYLGVYAGTVELSGVRVKLYHGERGGAYALSYNSQKVAEQITSGEKPHILLCGHWHTALYYFYRNIHIIHCGAFEGQTLYLLRKGINPVVGGWSVRVRVADDKKKSLVSCTPTFIPFFEGG